MPVATLISAPAMRLVKNSAFSSGPGRSAISSCIASPKVAMSKVFVVMAGLSRLLCLCGLQGSGVAQHSQFVLGGGQQVIADQWVFNSAGHVAW